MKPFVSVILPTYNRPTLLARALDSVAAQTFRDYEIIVVNDGGEGVGTVVGRYDRATYISHAYNRGLPAARNTAIRAATGQYLAYLDDDDWFLPDHLLLLTRGIEGHRAAYSDARILEAGGESIMAHEYNQPFLQQMNLFPCNAVLHERALIDEAGWFDESLPNSEDWDEWIRIGQITPWHHVHALTCCVDHTRATMSSDRVAMMKIFKKIRARYADTRVTA